MKFNRLYLILLFGLLCVSSMRAEIILSLSVEDVFTSSTELELITAIKKNAYTRVDKLLENISNKHEHELTINKLLWWQANIGNFEGFLYLLKKGGSPIYQAYQVLDADSTLELCASQDDPRFIETAIKYGANVNIISYNRRQTSIFSAIGSHNINNVKLLIDHGAYLDVANNMGSTPVLYAADLRAYDIVVLLLTKGANPDFKNIQGYDVRASLNEAETIGIIKKDDSRYKFFLKQSIS